MEPKHPTSEGLDEVVAAFLDNLYPETDWRQALEGEILVLDAAVMGREATPRALNFSDGVRQIGPSEPFDAIAVANVLLVGEKGR